MTNKKNSGLSQKKQILLTTQKFMKKKSAKPLRIASLNIGRGFFAKEELLIHTIKEHKIDISM
jgi:hypothetical protein